MRLRDVVFFALLCCGFSAASFAQSVDQRTRESYGRFDRDELTPEFHRERRALLLQRMEPGSIAVFLAAPRRTRANDVDYHYHQDPNFYYLTGHLDPEAALLLSKDGFMDANGTRYHEVLFVQKRDPDRETWTGVRLGPQGATEVLGFALTDTIGVFKRFLLAQLSGRSKLYFTPFEPKVTDPLLDTTRDLWSETVFNLTRLYPSLTVGSLTKEMAELRMVKTPAELRLMQRAIDISVEAHNTILRKVEPGWHEYEMQALGEYVFSKNGAEYTAYPCIVGGGNNSTILHYITNRRRTESGDFVEMDIGAEYHGYAADITRSFPVNGTFTKEQRIIYDLVLEAQDSGIKASVIDSSFRAPHNAAVSVITRGLMNLGIIKKPAEYRKYFMHGTSHYLGLDVHDAGTYGKLADQQVITVEPGIYIKEGSECDPKWWKIGCRIEDDILITRAGPVIMSKGLPRTADEVERIMREN